MPMLVGTVLFAAALFVWWTGSLLPEQVASHFGLSGRADSYMSRTGFIALMMTLVVVVPGVTWWAQRIAARRGKANIPNREIWFSAPHAESTARFLEAHAAWFTIALVVFMSTVHWLAVQANVAPGSGARLDNAVFLTLLGVFMAFVIGWSVWPMVRFRKRPNAGDRTHR